MSSRFNQEQNAHEPHPWLEEKVYAKLRQRTVDLVKQSIDALCKDKQRVSLSRVAAKSRELDAEHRGISESAILDNQEARAYYEQLAAGEAHQKSERNHWPSHRQLRREQSSLAGMSSECASATCA